MTAQAPAGRSSWMVAAGCAALLASAPSVPDGLRDAQAPLRVLSISAGPAGTDRDGVFTLTEERSIFSRTTDREVLVFFQWEGVPGPHTLVARWRSPDGSVSSSSTIEYVADDRRFGAYWPLVLSPRMPLGTWSVEATVDGQPAGRYTFEIRDDPVMTAPAARRPLTPAELYERLDRMFAVIDRTGPRGQRLEGAGGLLVADDRVCTADTALDAVDAVHVVGPDASRRPVDAVLGLSRANGWALLLTPGGSGTSRAMAPAGSSGVGDRIYTIDGGVAGGRMLRRGQVSGRIETPASPRILVSLEEGVATPGAPVVDEFGDPLGILAGPAVAGATRMMDLLRMLAEFKGHAVIPLSSVCNEDSGVARTLGELQTADALALPLTGEEHVVSGGFARGIERSPLRPTGQRDQFSIGEGTFVVFVNWNPVERLRGTTQLRIFDAGNRVMGESESKRSNFRKGAFALSYWELPVPRVPGLYRADVLFDGQPAWRGFVRVTP